MVVAQAYLIDVTASGIVFTFQSTQRTLRQKCEDERAWLETIAEKALGRRVPVSVAVQTVAAAVPEAAAPAMRAPAASPVDEELRREAMEDPTVQALFEIFPVEKAKIEEM